jgi:hypothetical protein
MKSGRAFSLGLVHDPTVKLQTEEFLYEVLWMADTVLNPTWNNPRGLRAQGHSGMDPQRAVGVAGGHRTRSPAPDMPLPERLPGAQSLGRSPAGDP